MEGLSSVFLTQILVLSGKSEVPLTQVGTSSSWTASEEFTSQLQQRPRLLCGSCYSQCSQCSLHKHFPVMATACTCARSRSLLSQVILNGDETSQRLEHLDPDTEYDVKVTAIYPDEAESEDLLGSSRTCKWSSSVP